MNNYTTHSQMLYMMSHLSQVNLESTELGRKQTKFVEMTTNLEPDLGI